MFIKLILHVSIPEGCVWYPGGVLRRNVTINTLQCFILHYIPAYILDIIARFAGKKPL